MKNLVTPNLDPVQNLAIHSWDLGSLYSPDGREHPATAHSLPFLASLYEAPLTSQHSSSDIPSDVSSKSPAIGPNMADVTASASLASIPSLPKMPSHLGARVVVGIVGLIILAIVVARLLK